ncbi:MAG: alpha/beta fold hydrolase, partial [Frankiaceae bacterium]|nr:alpha/beta fold hydrolase [Frankiaceae bacterium]
MTRNAAVRWRDVLVDGAVVRLMEAGDPAADPLLFLHGWGLSPACYADGFSRLTAAGVRVIAPCLPGFGGSDGPALLGADGGLRNGLDLASYATRIGRLLDVLGLAHPVFVAGHSFGGGVALQLAVQRPDRVRSLTLVNSVGGAPSRTPRDGRGMTSAAWWRWAAGAVTELSPREVAKSAPSMLRAFVPNALRKPVTLALSARLALTASLAGSADALVASGLPVLFVWGDADRLIARGEFSTVAGALPTEVVAGRHGWLMTQPE